MMLSKTIPLILGVQGYELTESEQIFLQRYRPAGVILFTRNCQSPQQVRRLVQSIRLLLENPCAPIVIDQEGAAVTRLKPPVWPKLPSFRSFGQLYQKNAATALSGLEKNIQSIALQLQEIEVQVVASPCADILFANTHPVLQNRVFSAKAQIVKQLTHLVCQHFLAMGVMPIVKHFPGHGRAQADSHKILPEVLASLDVLEQSDWLPYEQLCNRTAVMMGHLKIPAIDQHLPSSQSAHAYSMLRKKLGFSGLVFSDCIRMNALSGSLADRAWQVFAAGSDFVICSTATFEEAVDIAQVFLNNEAFCAPGWEQQFSLLASSVSDEQRQQRYWHLSQQVDALFHKDTDEEAGPDYTE